MSKGQDAAFVLDGDAAQAVATVADMLAMADKPLPAATRRLMAESIRIALQGARIERAKKRRTQPKGGK